MYKSRLIAAISISFLSACQHAQNYQNLESKSEEESSAYQAEIMIEHEKRMIEKQLDLIDIKKRFLCSSNKSSSEYQFVEAYLRDISVLGFSIKDEDIRIDLAAEIKIADKYISKKYKSKYFISDGQSTITDAFPNIRNPEILCVKKEVDEMYSAFIFTYSSRKNDYARVDRIDFLKENEAFYFEPPREPHRIDPEIMQMYREVGAETLPTTGIELRSKIFVQRP